METNPLKPTFSWKLQSRIAVQSAPLWLMKATFPGRAMEAAKVALKPSAGDITPRQLGPMMRMPPRCASARISCSIAAPPGPVSLKPAEMMMADGTPFAVHSRITPGTHAAGVTMTARSGVSGKALTLGKAARPSTVERLRFTGKTRPLKSARFSRTARPTLPSFSVAPMTAT
jgi:hypothetical protein